MISTARATAFMVAGVLQAALLPAVSYQFELRYDPATATVAGTQVISFTRDELPGAGVLALFNNAGAIPNPHRNPIQEDALYQSGFEPSYTEVEGIVDADGETVPYEPFIPPVHGRMFTYPIPELALRMQLPDRERYQLRVTFRTHLPALRAADGTSRDGVFVQRFGWFPRLYPDPTSFSLPPIADYRLRIVVPPGYQVISHAEEGSETAEGTAYLIESSFPVASIPLTIFPEDRFQLLEAAAAPQAVRLFHRPGHERQARKLIGYAAAALEHYAAVLGPLPYGQVTILEGVRPGAWGMAADGLVMLGSGAFNADVPLLEVWDRLLEFLVAHEVGHFYFGIGAVSDFISDNWLSESLTQYVTTAYLEATYGAAGNLFPDTVAGRIVGSLLPYTSIREQLYAGFHALRVSGFDFPVVSDLEARNQNGLTAVIYDKGALAVRQLAVEMGKDAFDAALADYVYRFRSQFVDTDRFIDHLERHRTGIGRIAAQVLQSDRYSDYRVERVVHEGGVSRITVRDYRGSGLAAPVRVVLGDGDAADGEVREFTVRGGEVLEVAGRVREVAIDPDWYTLDTNRKNNHYPRKLNWLRRRHSPYEADLVGLDLRLLEATRDAVSLGVGVGYSSTGLVSVELAAGFASIIPLPRPIDPMPSGPADPAAAVPAVEPGTYASLSLALPGAARAAVDFRWFDESGWLAALIYRQPLRVPVEVGTRPTYYGTGLSLAAGLTIDQRPLLQSWLGLDSIGLVGTVPHFASLRQDFTVLPDTKSWSLWSSLALAVPLRLVPRVYLVPSVDLGADWQLFGVGTLAYGGVPSRLRAGPAAETGAATPNGRTYGGLDLLFTLVGGREDRLLNLVIFRSLTAALYLEAENLFAALPDLVAGDLWEPHAGIELSAGFTSLLDLPLPIGVGLDVPLRSAADPYTWRVFLSLNLPLRLYTTLLTD